MQYEDIESRFWKYVDKSDGESCWNWTGAKLPHGYGQLSYRDKGKSRLHYAHRLSYTIHFGEIPSGLCVCHHCDNPGCVNPNHLFIGTDRDNTMDMVHKGRWGGGRFRKISPEQEQELIVELNSTLPDTLQRLAKKYKVGISTIRRYRNKNHVPGCNKIRANEIRQKYSTGKFKQQELADEYGLHYSAISLIVRGKRD